MHASNNSIMLKLSTTTETKIINKKKIPLFWEFIEIDSTFEILNNSCDNLYGYIDTCPCPHTKKERKEHHTLYIPSLTAHSQFDATR